MNHGQRWDLIAALIPQSMVGPHSTVNGGRNSAGMLGTASEGVYSEVVTQFGSGGPVTIHCLHRGMPI